MATKTCPSCAGTGHQAVPSGSGWKRETSNCPSCWGTGTINVPDPPRGNTAQDSGKCFIATATYGSTLAPEVVFFREFRDERLLTSKTGAKLVDLYYRASPPCARLIEKVPMLRRVVRTLLLSPILNWIVLRTRRSSSLKQ